MFDFEKKLETRNKFRHDKRIHTFITITTAMNQK